MEKISRPTVDDYSRFLDEVSGLLVDRIVLASRIGDHRLSAEFRAIQTYIETQRSKRGL